MGNARNLAKLAVDSNGDVAVGSLPAEINVNASAPADSLAISSAGNVGIGTTSPAVLLHVYKTTGRNDYRIASGSSSGEVASVQFYGTDSGSAAQNYAQIIGGVTTNTAGSEAGYLSFETVGSGSVSERMRIDSSGKVGVGTSSPASKLSIQDTAGTGDFGNGVLLDLFGGSISAIDTGVGISFTRTGSQMAYIQARRESASTEAAYLAFATQTSAGSHPERMRIDSSGNVLIGTTTTSVATEQGIVLKPTEGFLLNNSTTLPGQSLILLYSSYSTADQTKFEVTSEGNVKSRTNSYAGFSDERLKQGITSSSSQWDDIKNIEVVKFQMKSEQLSDEENPWMLGVVAQQVENISPGLVENDSKDGMKTVKYSVLYMKAVKALQEAMGRIEILEAENNALKSRLDAVEALEARIAALEAA